jgi:hypothetical protein
MGILATALRRSDAAAGKAAELATTFGQLALLGLGCHLAADRLDDHLYRHLTRAQDGLADVLVPGLIRIGETVGLAPGLLVGWADCSLVSTSAALALIIELAAIVALAGAIVLTPRESKPTFKQWWAARSVHAMMLPLTLVGVLLAGAWSLAMAAEDLLPASSVAPWAAGVVALAATARFGVPATTRALAALDPKPPWRTGLKRALVLTPIAALVWIEALPIWGVPGLLWGTP